jgi:hypothetical protein
MGAGFSPKTNMIEYNGQQVTIKLDQVFRNPGTPRYQKAQAASQYFGNVKNEKDNWKDLLIAYLRAGVDVGNEFPAWCEYLSQLGAGNTGTQGPQNIYDIAQARFNALTHNPPQGMQTRTHGGGGPVHTQPGSGANPADIDSPCPPGP